MSFRIFKAAASALTTASLLAGLLLVSAPTLVLAGTQGSCGSSDSSKVRLWENVEGETIDGDDSYWQCTNETNLAVGDDHTLPGDCNRPFPGSTTWNDCVSSITIWVPKGQTLCLYGDASHAAFKDAYAGPRSEERHDVGAGWNDALSSFKWVSGGEVNC